MSEPLPPQAEPLHRGTPAQQHATPAMTASAGSALSDVIAGGDPGARFDPGARQLDQDAERDTVRSGMAELCARHRPPPGSGPGALEGQASAPAAFGLRAGGMP